MYAPQPFVPPPPRERSYLGLLTVSVLAVVMGAMAIVDNSGWVVPAAAYVVTALCITATGLIVGAWYGRSRALIALGIVLAVAIGPATLADAVGGGDWRDWDSAENVQLRPTSGADVLPVYEYGAGSLRLDLRALDEPNLDLSTRIEIGAGEVIVILPDDLDVTINADNGAGEVNVLGSRSSGFGSSRSVTDLGVDGAGGGELHLDIDLGLGTVEVRREAA